MKHVPYFQYGEEDRKGKRAERILDRGLRESKYSDIERGKKKKVAAARRKRAGKGACTLCIYHHYTLRPEYSAAYSTE